MRSEKSISTVRRIFGDLVLAVATILTADVFIVMMNRVDTVVLKANSEGGYHLQMLVCAFLILFGLDIRFGIFTAAKSKALRVVGWIVRVIVALHAAVIIFFGASVIYGSLIRTDGPADNAIVLGLALENGSPTADLISRIETAADYLDEYPDAHLILTGGNADLSGLTEAEVMRDLLLERGVPEDRLILEDQATTTIENFENIARMIDPDEPVVLISSNYHMFRAAHIARRAGFTEVLRRPAPSRLQDFPVNMILEVLLNVNEVMQ